MSDASMEQLAEPRPCSACGETSGYLVTEVVSPNYEFSNAIEPLTLTAAMLENKKAGLFSSAQERVPVKLAARVCGGCARVEFFVQDLALLERFAAAGIGNVRKF